MQPSSAARVAQTSAAIHVSFRTRVIERIGRAAAFPVAIIAAPAGFGKSIALTQYLSTQRCLIRRVDVEHGNGDFRSFARTFAVAVLDTDVVAKAQSKVDQNTGSSAELAAWFASQLTETDLTIAVDGLHHAAGVETYAFLSKLVDRTHDRIRWILSSRSSLDLPIATWMAYGTTDLAIDEDVLRLTIEEASATARESGLLIKGDDIKALMALTGGWPTPLSIALRTYSRDSAEKEFPATRELMDRYFTEQILATLGQTERDFLFRTCAYPSVDSELLVDAGFRDGAALIQCVRRAGVPLYPDAGSAFRYDETFRRFLERAVRANTTRDFADSILESAKALEQAGKLGDALSIHTRLDASDEIARILVDSGFELIEQGSFDGVRSALARVPDEVQFASPILLAIKATIESNVGGEDRADAWFTQAINLERNPVTKLDLERRHAADRLGRLNPEAIEQLLAITKSPHITPDLLALTCAEIAYGYLVTNHNLAEAQRHSEMALENSQNLRDNYIRARILHAAACVMFESKEREKAAQYALNAVNIAQELEYYDLCVRAWSILYSVAVWQDDAVKALWYVQRMLECAVKGSSIHFRQYALALLQWVETERGDDVALANVDAMLDELNPQLSGISDLVAVTSRAWRTAWRGDFRLAAQLAETLKDDRDEELRVRHNADLAVFAAAAGDRVRAREAAREALKVIDDMRRTNRISVAARGFAALTAIAFTLLGSGDQAREILKRLEEELPAMSPRIVALVRAAKSFLSRAEGQSNDAEMLSALDELRAHSFGGAARLLEALPLPSLSADPRFETLTATEAEILRAIASGATSKEIAAATGRSAQTVDVHVKSIVRKLGCRGRAEAIAVAHSSGYFAN